MHFNDEWAKHAVSCPAVSSSPAPAPRLAYAVLVKDLPAYFKIADSLSGMEREVYNLLYVDKVGSNRTVAKLLNKPTKDISTYCKRIDHKLARCWSVLKPILVELPDSDPDEESEAKEEEFLSCRNHAPQVGVTTKNPSACRRSAHA